MPVSSSKKSKSMNLLKSLLGLLVLGVTLCALTAAGGAVYVGYQFEKKGPHAAPIEVLVPRGSHIGAVAESLEQKGILTEPALFEIIGRITGQARKIKAGEYEIAAHASMNDILTQMEKGQTIARRFTVREGLTSFEVVRLLNGVEKLTGEITRIPPEGSLLPNTYDYQRGEDRQAVIDRLTGLMIKTLREECGVSKDISNFDDLLAQPCGAEPLKTVKDVLILASIVEKETSVPEERERVAGVFINRLKKGMPLQTDPTVIYAITKGKHKNDGKGPLGRRLLRKDLQIDDPYNTYKYPGLTPGPIANPGAASIAATLNPEAHEYIFFVADGTGGHAFGKTLAEHNANVAKWRKIRRAQNQ